MTILSILTLLSTAALAGGPLVDTTTTEGNGSDAAHDEVMFDIEQESEGRVVGGNEVAEGDWESVVGLNYLNFPHGWGVECTGTLITPNLVLTAGHCVNGVTSVVVGSNDLSDPNKGEWIPVRRIEPHPTYPQQNDSALLLLAWESSIEPAIIAQDCITDDYLYDGAPLVIVGHGAVNTQGTLYVPEMYEGFTEVTDHDCSVAGEGCVGPMEPDGEMIAGGPNGIDTCYGDSGGPGFLQTPDGDFLMGVISRGTWSAGWFCGNGGGTIFVRADSLVPWIEARTGQILERPSCPGQVPPPVQSAALDEEGAVDAAPAGCTATGRSTGNAGWLGVLGVVLLGIRRRARSATAILSA